LKRRGALGSLLGLGAALAGGCALDPVKRTLPAHDVLDRELAAIAGDPARALASLAVLAIRDGAVAYEACFGRRHVERALPATASTLYRVASISKLVTTLGVLRLVEEGRLDLDADLGGYLGHGVRNPAFPQVPVTLRMILSHTSSLTDAAGYYTFDEGVRLRDVFAQGGAMWSPHPPGAYFRYANFPWGVAATAMERVTGERFDRLMRRLVLQPLGMRGGYNVAELEPAILADLATLYRKRPAGDGGDWDTAGPWVPQVDDYATSPPVARASAAYAIGTNGTLFGPQGGLRTSTADLGRVMRMLMGRGELDGGRFLKAATVGEMLRTQWRHDGANGESTYGSHRGRFNAWGLGNQQFVDLTGPDFGDRLVEGGAGFRAVGHLGDAYGLMGTFAFDPSTRNGVLCLAGGTGFDPETDRGRYSSGAGFEERILTALYRRAVLRVAT
jgi:CubicO group peptidase (beta-lactamase class C family)